MLNASANRPRALVLTDFLADWTGSEIVALEVAEHLQATTSSFWCAEPMRSRLQDWRPLEAINLAEFDFVWAQQHAVFPLLDKLPKNSRRPFIAWASLSPYDVMDDVPQSVRSACTDLTVCNSEETALARGGGVSFGNAAPNPFHFERPARPLRRVLFVSNNQPAEILEAEALLTARGYETRFLGRGREYKLLEPADIAWADCVVTIGKTARYALASGTPVFIYDRFGGGGYITPETYATNEANNFSGRPECRRLNASQIADEIIANYACFPLPPQPRLGDFLDRLVANSALHTAEHHPDLHAVAQMSLALGSFLAQTQAWRHTATAHADRAENLQSVLHGNLPWRQWREIGWAKLRKSRFFPESMA